MSRLWHTHTDGRTVESRAVFWLSRIHNLSLLVVTRKEKNKLFAKWSFTETKTLFNTLFLLKRWSAATNLLALLEHLLKDLLLAVEDDQVGLWHEDLLQHVSVSVLVVRKLLHHNTEVLRRNHCKLRTNPFGAPYLALFYEIFPRSSS